MIHRHSALVSAAAMFGIVFVVNGARADDMGSMDMGGMTHQMMPEQGENAASMDRMMSSEHMEHDPMMAAHMGYTALRSKNDADQHRADELVARFGPRWQSTRTITSPKPPVTNRGILR